MGVSLFEGETGGARVGFIFRRREGCRRGMAGRGPHRLGQSFIRIHVSGGWLDGWLDDFETLAVKNADVVFLVFKVVFIFF